MIFAKISTFFGGQTFVPPGVEEREFGGLGIFMVKNITDSAEYRREGAGFKRIS